MASLPKAIAIADLRASCALPWKGHQSRRIEAPRGEND